MPLSGSVTEDPGLLDQTAFERDLRRAVLWPSVGLAGAFALLLALTLFLLHSAEWVDHTDRVIAKSSELANLAMNSVRGVRAYQLTGDAVFLEPWTRARSRIGPAFDELAALVADNPRQTKAAAEMVVRWKAWEAFATGAVERVQAGGDSRDVALNLEGNKLFDAFDESGKRLEEEERRLLGERNGNLQHLRRALLGMLGALALIGIPVMARFIWKLVWRVAAAYRSSLSAARLQRDELRTSLNAIGDAVLATDANGCISFLNPVAETLTGWTDAEARGRILGEVFDIYNSETGAPAANPVERVLRERKVVGLANHTSLRRRGGGDIPIEDSAAPILRADGSLLGVILVFRDVTEKYAQEQALREAAWLARRALEVGGAGAWVLDTQAGLVYGDEAMARTFGLPADRVRKGEPTETFLASVHPDDRERVRAALTKALETGDFYVMEYRVRGEGGVERWVDGRGRIEEDATGRATRMPGFLYDVTARKLSDLALRASEARARAIVDTALDAVLLMNSDGSIAGWNAAAERIFGWRSEEVLGRDLAERIIPERLREAHRRGLEHILATGEGPVLGRRLELAALRRDGSEFPVELTINRLPDTERAMFVGYLRDITARKAVETELADRARLAALRAEIAALLASMNSDEVILRGCCELLVGHLDAAFARIWMMDSSEPVLVLRASAGLYTHLDGPHGRVPVGQFKIGRIAQNRRAHLTNDVEHDPNISDPQWAAREGMKAFAGYPLIAEGRMLGVLALFSRNPLTEAVLGDLAPIADAIAISMERRSADAALLVAKERAEAAAKAKDDFLAALSHELRTPLTPVLMTAAMLRQDERLPADVRNDLGMIERNVALEARLIDDLLDLTRLTKGKLTLRDEECDVHSLIGHVVEILRDDAVMKKVAVDVGLSARRSALRGDSARLQQVFWNVLRNAIKFTPEGGEVAIRTRDETDERLRIEVQDSGIGFSPEAAESIFAPFEQAGRADDHRFGGLGLGLAIARAIVDLHGGTIRGESAGKDQGATFIVEFPRVGDQPRGVTAVTTQLRDDAAQPGPYSKPKALRLLLVEDHEPTLAVLSRLLLRAGHSVVTAVSVASAKLAAEAQTFDVLISDLGLPDGTGVEVMTVLREMQPGVRGIALSGYGMEQDRRRSIEAGFAVHLVKPVDFSQLTKALNEVASL